MITQRVYQDFDLESRAIGSFLELCGAGKPYAFLKDHRYHKIGAIYRIPDPSRIPTLYMEEGHLVPKLRRAPSAEPRASAVKASSGRGGRHELHGVQKASSLVGSRTKDL